jgi:SAM-dependent methyltransferase
MPKGATMAERGEADYIHGTSPSEQARLSLLNSLLNEACLQELDLRGDERIIDFGCGLAQFTRLMARRVHPGGEVLGIERDCDQLAEALRQSRQANEFDLVELRQGDVNSPPLAKHEWETFDLAHARFLLEHLHDPLAAVRSMVRALRPGGRIILADDDHDLLRIWPEPPGFLALWDAYMQTYQLNSTDPQIGRRLVSLICTAGARPTRNRWIFFGSCSGNPNFEGYVENLIGVILTAKERILADQLCSRGSFDETLAALRTWSKRPDAALWYGLCWAEGVKQRNLEN